MIKKLLSNSNEVITKELPKTFEELNAEAERFGKVEIGRMWSNNVSIKCNFTTPDFVVLSCRRHADVKDNLAEVLAKAKALTYFYETLKEYI